MKRSILCLAALALCWGGGAPVFAGTITNGSFEDTTHFVGDANNTMTLSPGSNAMPSWTVFSNAVAWIGPSNHFGIVASEGSYSLDLQGYSDGSPYGGVQQTVATTVGHNYLLQFDVGTLGLGTTTTIAASAGAASTNASSTNLNLNGSQQWETKSLPFTANSASTLISLLGITASDGGIYIGLDNAVLTDLGGPVPAPEPATITLLGIGVAGMAARGLRRRKQPA